MASLLVFFLVFFSTPCGGIKGVDRNILTSVRLMGCNANANHLQGDFAVNLCRGFSPESAAAWVPH